MIIKITGKYNFKNILLSTINIDLKINKFS